MLLFAHINLTLPLEDPILKFLLILVIILAAPLLLNKLKIIIADYSKFGTFMYVPFLRRNCFSCSRKKILCDAFIIYNLTYIYWILQNPAYCFRNPFSLLFCRDSHFV